VGAPSTERGGPAQAYGRFAEIAPEEAGKAAEERAAEQAQEASTRVVFRWRVDFGLSARKARQLVTVVLANGAANEVPALAVLCDLVRPPDGMTANEMADRRRVFAPADSSPAAVKRQLTKSEKAS
jgi:hypothetical protein